MKLKNFRKMAGLTQSALAEAADVSQALITHIERGRRTNILLPTARKIVAALNQRGVSCSVDDVFPPEAEDEAEAA